MALYKCFACDYDELVKRINRITKKLASHNLNFHFEKISEQVELIKVQELDHINKVTIKHEPILKATVIYSFNMDTLKIGDYEAIAIINHENDYGNMIYKLTEEIEIDEKYRTIKSTCEHCNTERYRKKPFY